MVNYVSHELVKDLGTATVDLDQVNPLTGLLRFGIIGLIFLSLVVLAWSADKDWPSSSCCNRLGHLLGLELVVSVFG